eukprot:g181.t1
MPREEALCAVSVVRSGDILLEAVRQIVPGIAVGKILVQRDESDPEKRPKLFYSKFPPNLPERDIILVDPMLATGGSAKLAIKILLEAGAVESKIIFLNVVSCPEGVAAIRAAYPAVRLMTSSIDSHLNADKFIVPGLGDFGDRYYGT